MHIYIYKYIYIWQRLNKSVPWTVSLENGQTVRYLKGLNNLKFATRNKPIFLGFVFSEFYEKTSEIDLRRHIHARLFTNVTFFKEIRREKGACGRYKDTNKNVK